MLVAHSWLRDFAPVPDPDDLIPVLNGLGMVVEAVERVGEGLEHVIIAKVLATRPHPGADRVQLVDVDAGGEPMQIVCGAFNFKAGDLVPLAPVGAVLPGGFEIGRRKVRGEWSNGMLCSATELALGGDSSGILIVGEGATPGQPLTDALGIEADVVYDLDITANRPDAMCVAGVARDLAGKLRLPFTLPTPSHPSAGPAVDTLATAAVECEDLCPRLTVRVLHGVAIGTSPPWMQRRLEMAGMRPINSVVDASNYVMLELGQPTHPYDLDQVPGRGLIVRRARVGEVVVTLDGAERRVGDGDDCLICDAEGVPVGIGGIMGGASSEISPTTTNVLLEAAYFTPMAIARTAKRLRLRTEASARFERGTDPEIIDLAAARLIELIGAEAAPGVIDVRSLPVERPRIELRTAKVNGLLGTELGDDEIVGHLAGIGFAPVERGDGRAVVEVPSWRPDVSIEVDLIEEVARHHGYERIPRAVPPGVRVGGLTPFQKDVRRLRDVLCGAGISEASNPPLVGPGDHEKAGVEGDVVGTIEPMIKEESILRRSMLPGLMRNLAFNASRRTDDAWLFEIGRVWLPIDRSAPLPLEVERLAVAMAGADANEAVAVLDVVVDALRLADVTLEATETQGMHPGRTAAVRMGGTGIGFVGEVDPAVVAAYELRGRVGWIEVDLQPLLLGPRRDPHMAPVSRYPSNDVDLAFVVPDEVPAAAIERAVLSAGGPLLEHCHLFDVYRGAGVPEGTRGLAYRLRFQAQDRTLTDAEVGEVRRAIIAAAEAAGATLRGT